MQEYFLKRTFLLVSFFLINALFAQDPDWTVNPQEYQYSMTFTTFLSVNGNTLSSENDKVAAFVGNEVRGVSSVVYESNRNKYVAYLTVFANTSGEELSFKLYDSENDEIVPVTKKENFIIDGNLGSVFQSYSLASPALNTDAILTSFSFKDVEELSITQTDNNLKVIVPLGTDITALKSEFLLSDGAKVFVNRTYQETGITINNFTDTIIFSVLSEDESVLNDYFIEVIPQEYGITVISELSANQTQNTSSNAVLINVSFSEEVEDLYVSFFELKNAVVTNKTKITDKTFTLTLVALMEGEFSIKIIENKIQAANGDFNLASNTLSFIFDKTAPLISDLELKNINNQTYFSVIFSEPVLNVNTTDFQCIGSLSPFYSIDEIIKVNEKEFQLKVTNTSSQLGTIFLKVKSSSDIKDISGNSILIQTSEPFFLDNLPPVIEALEPLTVECGITITDRPKAIDEVAGEVFGTTLSTLSFSNKGEYEIEWNFNDGNGNTSTAIQYINVVDDTPPSTPTLEDVKSQCSVTLVPPTTEDNCTGTITGITNEEITYNVEGTYEVTWIFDDGNGNTSSAVQKVIIDNSFSPIAPQLPNLIGECALEITNIPETEGNGCSEIIQATTNDSLSYNEQGEYEITWTFDYGNNIILNSIQKVIIADAVPPEIISNDFELELDALGNATLNISDIDNGSFDNCEILSYELSKTNFTLADLGQNNITLTIIDVNGNTSSASVIVTVTQNSLSSESFELDKLVTIYPNPVRRNLTIQKEQNLTIMRLAIFSSNGKEIFSRNHFQETIDVNNFSSGIYFLKLTTKKGIFVKKFIKHQ